MVKPHVAPRLMTYPLSEVGEMLFKDGLFLTALTRLITHASKTPFLANYVYEYLNSAFNIEHNQFIFQESTERARVEFEKHLEERFMEKYSKFKQDRFEMEPKY